MGTSFKGLRLFFRKVSFIINKSFPFSHETLCAGHIKLFAAASVILPHAVFQLVMLCKTAFWECIHQGAKRMEVGGS